MIRIPPTVSKEIYDALAWMVNDLEEHPIEIVRRRGLNVGDQAGGEIPEVPVSPVNLVVFGGRGVLIRWDYGSDPSIKAFEVRRSQSPDMSLPDNLGRTTGTSFADPSVRSTFPSFEATYYYQVRSVRDTGELSEWSQILEASTGFFFS